MWTALAGAIFWILGFILIFVVTSPEAWIESLGTVMFVAGILLIFAGGQIIRVTISGETIQPTAVQEKVRVLVCPGCSAENPNDARFCMGCGKRIKRRAE